LRLNVRSLFGSTGLSVTTIRGLMLGVPVMSTAATWVNVTVSGVPPTKLAIPESCQP